MNSGIASGSLCEKPNAQVHRRPCEAWASVCNAQLGWWQVNGSMCMRPLCVDCRANGPFERKHATSLGANQEAHAWLIAAAEKAARMACACGEFSIGLTPKVSGAVRSAATEGHQQGPGQWRSHGPCWRPLDRPVRRAFDCLAGPTHRCTSVCRPRA